MSKMTVRSPIWAEETDHSRKRKYDHAAVETFLIEAMAVTDCLYQQYHRWQLKFHQNDRTAAKAAWMLGIECIETLREAICLLREKRHRAAGRLLRQALEAVDLASLFVAQDDNGKHLRDWYAGCFVGHSNFRNHLKASNMALEQERKTIYELLSEWPHNNFRVLSNSYLLGQGDFLVHDQVLLDGQRTNVLVLPETIYQYCWLASVVMCLALPAMSAHGFLPQGFGLNYKPKTCSKQPGTSSKKSSSLAETKRSKETRK